MNQKSHTIHDAIANNDDETFLRLVKIPNMVENLDEYDCTPLINAVYNDRPKMVAKLIESGAKVNARDNEGRTAIYWGVNEQRIECIQLLLKRRPDLNLAKDNGNTPLILAAKKGFADIVKMLVDAGAQLGPTDADGRTALDWARDNQHEACVHLLAPKGRASQQSLQQEVLTELKHIQALQQQIVQLRARLRVLEEKLGTSILD